MYKILAPALLLATFMTAFIGCSNRSIYEAVQTGNMHECQFSQESVRERCMERVSESYEDYEKSRQEILEDEL